MYYLRNITSQEWENEKSEHKWPYIVVKDGNVENLTYSPEPVEFKDEAVKDICEMFFNYDGDGYVSKKDVGQYTGDTLEYAFYSGSTTEHTNLLKKVKSLDDLEYFTGMTAFALDQGFKGCTSLNSITFPKTLRQIGKDGVNSQYRIFSVNSVSSVTFTSDYVKFSKYNSTVGSTLFITNQNKYNLNLSFYGKVDFGGYENLAGNNSFNHNSKYGELNIGGSLTNFWNTGGFSEWPYYFTSKVLKCYLTDHKGNRVRENAYYKTIDGYDGCIFSKDESELVFYDRTLTALTLPSSVTKLGPSSLRSSSLTGEITIPDNVIEIDRNCFYGCTGITKLNLNKVNRINTQYSGVETLTIGRSTLEDIDWGDLNHTLKTINFRFYAKNLWYPNSLTGFTDGYANARQTTNGTYVVLPRSCDNFVSSDSIWGRGNTNQNLKYFVVLSDSMAKLTYSSNAFVGTNIQYTNSSGETTGEGSIYVQESLIPQYQTNANWSHYSFKPLREVPDEIKIEIPKHYTDLPQELLDSMPSS